MGEIISIYTTQQAIEDGILIRLADYFSGTDFPGIMLEALEMLRDVGGRFELGQLIISAHAAKTLQAADVLIALIRHQLGDWGELERSDRRANEKALACSGRLFSAYRDASRVKFWIITEGHPPTTTVLLPQDY